MAKHGRRDIGQHHAERRADALDGTQRPEVLRQRRRRPGSSRLRALHRRARGRRCAPPHGGQPAHTRDHPRGAGARATPTKRPSASPVDRPSRPSRRPVSRRRRGCIFLHQYRTARAEHFAANLRECACETPRKGKQAWPVEAFGLLGARNHLPRPPARLFEKLEPVAHRPASTEANGS
jgi:hypothetical protein